MKILVISDTHGYCANFERAYKKVRPVDMIIHLGDISRDAETISGLADCRVVAVSGNNDFFTTLPKTEDLTLHGLHIHAEHGHRLPLRNMQSLSYFAEENGIDILMHGHTHVPSVDNLGGIWIINPGSLTLPRQSDRRPSYIIMEIDDSDKVHFNICYL